MHQTGLENRRSGNVTLGSNPSLSAVFLGYSPRMGAAHGAPFASCSTRGDGTSVGTRNRYPGVSIPRTVPPHPQGAMTGHKHGPDLLAMYDTAGRLMFIFESGREVDLIAPEGDCDSPITGDELSRALAVDFDDEDSAGFTYFIGGDVGAIKIGRSINPEKRLREFQPGSPIPLRILATRPGANRETIYHRHFAEHRLHGEWFAPHPDILAEIARLTEGTTHGY